MSQETHFPISFLTIRKTKEADTTKGLYLRWFVKPYLGIIGISPLNSPETQKQGFRVFRTTRTTIPPLTQIPITTILPKEHPPMVNLRDKQGWVAFYNKNKRDVEIIFDLYRSVKNTARYLRFSYRLHKGQNIRLHYVTHRISTQTETTHEIPLEYTRLTQELRPQQTEELTYAILMDNQDEYIKQLKFSSNRVLIIGDFYFSDPKENTFYLWTPDGGNAEWKELQPGEYITATDQLIKPIDPTLLVATMKEFYQEYYNKQPNQTQTNKAINFLFPDLSQFPITQPPLREYNADQYEMLCKGNMDPGPISKTRFQIPAQDAACLASTDPAIAHLLGLFRILKSTTEMDRPSIYKIQCTWPDGKRFCVYSSYTPSPTLDHPLIKPLTAKQKESSKVLKDYLTFRIHDRINVADLSWETIPATPGTATTWFNPVAYIILRYNPTVPQLECISPFLIPQEADQTPPPKIHFTDWFDQYPKTDVNKVLDGDYKYTISGFDIFGQMSDFKDDQTHITPIKLKPGDIEKPEITLSKLPDPTNPTSLDQVEIPIEIVKQDSTYKLKKYNSQYLTFDLSFFWPLTSRYVWNKNRATGKPSLDHFKLYYLIDTPFYSIARFKIVNNNVNGIEVDIEQVRESTSSTQYKNSQVFALLKKLDAVSPTGILKETKTEIILKNGSLIFGRKFNIASVAVSALQAKITLLLLPEQKNEQEIVKKDGFYSPITKTRYSEEQGGQLHWNLEAKESGTRIGWKQLSAISEKIQPSPIVDYNGNLIGSQTTPNTPIEMPTDLEPKTGLACYVAPEESETDYHFTIKLPKTDPLSNHHRLQFTALDPDTSLEPGEHKKTIPPPETEVDVPQSAQILFSEDRILNFYAVRIADDPQQPTHSLYRGQPIPFTSTANNTSKEYLVYPDSNHSKWRATVPNFIVDKQLPLNGFIEGKTFNEDNYLTANLSVAVEAVVTDQDPEVQTNLQKTFVTKKIGFLQYLPPPTLLLPEKPQPTFGVAASPPDYNGKSLIRVQTIYEGYDLQTNLLDNLEYILYRVPADRLVPGGMPVEYAQDPNQGNTYRRNMLALTQALASPEGTGLANPQVATTFKDHAEKVNGKALPKQEFLKLPIILPGESRTVFLHAIKAYDSKAKKESDQFTQLSPPIYVEDATKPASPLVRSASATINTDTNTLTVNIKAAKKLDPTSGYGYASDTELTSHNLLTDNFFNFTKQYRLYLTTEINVVADPDDSDFAPVPTATSQIGTSAVLPNFDPTTFSIKLKPANLQITQPPGTDTHVEVTVTLHFAGTIDLSRTPARIYLSLRAENHLNQLTDLNFFPIALS